MFNVIGLVVSNTRLLYSQTSPAMVWDHKGNGAAVCIEVWVSFRTRTNMCHCRYTCPMWNV